jgi:hypothetical protein
MRILYLCPKEQYDTKMSRVRFHSMAAIAKIADVVYSGVGWDNYNNDKSVSDNIASIYCGEKPDLVVAYKPLHHKEFSAINIPKCLRYNEMWDKSHTAKEIVQSGVNLIVCHHLNDISYYKKLMPDRKFVNISHCAEQTIYKDYGLPKTIDVLLTGAISRHYPFRIRLSNIIMTKLDKIVKCKILHHPGGVLDKSRGCILDDYAKMINSAKITLTCSSAYKYRLGKYIEIPMCASLLAADLPDEDHEFFKKFMLVLDPQESDGQIVEKILYYVNNDNERNNLIHSGVELNKDYTQEKYAERFLTVVKRFLNGENIC